MHHLELYKQPKKFLEKLIKKNLSLATNISRAMAELKMNQLPKSSKKLTGYKELYRIRIDKYRIVYQFDDSIVHILLIEKRDKIYAQIKNYN